MPISPPRLAALAFAAASGGSAVAHAAEIHVSPGESIAAAVNRAAPGDRVLVHAGTYRGGGWIGRRGTAAAPIVVVSADGPRRAVIEGGAESLRVGDASAYLMFDGFEVRHSGSNVVHIDGGSHHITLRNLYAHDAGRNGDVVKINQAHHITVERSEFARPGRRDIVENPYQECLDFVDVDDSVIRDSHFHDGGSMLLFVKGGSRNTVIERNVFSHQRAGASDPVVGLGGPTDPHLLDGERYEAINVVFRNNVVTGGATGAVAVYDADGAFIANNLFVDNDRVLVEFRAGNGPAAESRNVRVVNNLMVDTRGRMPEPYRRSSHGLREFSTSHNLFWNAGAPTPRSSLLDVASEPGHLAADPLLTATPAPLADREAILAATRPRAGSPARASGTDAAGAPFGVVDDIRGNRRAAPFDRGPFLLSEGTTPPPPPPPAEDAAAATDAAATDAAATDAPASDAGRDPAPDANVAWPPRGIDPGAGTDVADAAAADADATAADADGAGGVPDDEDAQRGGCAVDPARTPRDLAGALGAVGLGLALLSLRRRGRLRAVRRD